LQIDVEGAEWAPLLQAFKDLAEGKMSVGQMQVEMHTNIEVRGARREFEGGGIPAPLQTMMWCLHLPPPYTHTRIHVCFSHCLTPWVRLDAPCACTHTL